MKSKEIEILFLTWIEKLNGELQLFLFDDLAKLNGKLKLPRCMIKTISSSVVGKYTNEKKEVGNYIRHFQTSINKNLVTISITGSKEEEAAKIRDFFNNNLTMFWKKKMEKLDITVESVSELRSLSDSTTSDTIERYVFDIIVRSPEETYTDIEIIKEVEFAIKQKKE